MPRKSILFASVALPFMSMSLMTIPAHALTAAPVVRASGVSDFIRIQATPDNAEAPADGEAEPKPKRPPAPEPEPQPGRAESEAPPRPREAQPEQRQPAPEPAPEPAQPEPAQATPLQAEPAPPRAEPKAEPAETPPAAKPQEPEPRPVPQVAPAEQPAAPAATPPSQPEKRPVETEAKPAAQPAEAPKPTATEARPEPAAEEPAKPAQRPAKPPVTEPAVNGADTQQPVPPAAQAPTPETAPARQPAQNAVPTPEPSPAPQPEKTPVPEIQPDPKPGQQPADQADRPRSGKTTIPAPQDGASTGQAPAGEPAPAQVAVPQQEAPPMTPQQLERAKEIAKNPSASSETVILPVNKGAAVLDSDKEAERAGSRQNRDERRKERESAAPAKLPTTDAEAQVQSGQAGKPPAPVAIEAITREQGERVRERPVFDRPEGVRERPPQGYAQDNGRPRDGDTRILLQFGDRTVVRNDDSRRFTRDGEESYYERLPGGRSRETIERGDRGQIVTIRNRYGDIIQRSRIDARGREYVLFYAPELVDEPDRDRVYRDPGLDLPPMRLQIPVGDYITDTTSDPDRDYYDFLDQPPVERVERVYSLDEVKYSARIRDKVRRIDLDTITFATGSADVPMAQAKTLRKVADAIAKILSDNPAETFLIEGHTDAVGSDESNLLLSDQRAESVANVLSDVYGIAPENLATQGYGERYLKVGTLVAEQANRRVTIRRVTALVKPVASRN